MLDITAKSPTLREATALATLVCSPGIVERVRARDIPKGDPLPVARVAAIQAAKDTQRIIPYCHPVPIEHVAIEFELLEDRIQVKATAKAVAKTGLEMEALTAAAVAALTLYDMLKMLDEVMYITEVKLLSKRGGRSDFRDRLGFSPRAGVLVLSDSVSAGEKEDTAGKAIAERLTLQGYTVEEYLVLPDDREQIITRLKAWADELALDIVLTTGGTGFSPTDTTPEAMADVIDREAPGIAEAARAYGQNRTPYSMLSRGRSGFRGRTLIINLPGSRKGVSESLDALFPGLDHAFKMARGGGHPEVDRHGR